MTDPIIYPLTEAKIRLGQLIARAIAGEEIALSKGGIPAVVLVPMGAYGHLMESFRRQLEVASPSQNVTEPSHAVTPRHGVSGEGT